MRRLFADTHFYLALLNRADACHGRSVEFYRRESFDGIITTAWVLVELADGMLNAHSREACSRFIEHLRHDPETTIIQSDPEWMWRGFELYRKRPDKDWSLTDCISFVVMADEGLVEALTGDHHFKQAGFKALLA
jgi:predicted nucleic acid-binding protein